MSMRLGIHRESAPPPSPLSFRRERAQSAVLTWCICLVLALCAISCLITALRTGATLRPIAVSLLISATFGTLVWLLRAATKGGVAAGMLVCLLLLLPPAGSIGTRVRYNGLIALISLFVISFLVTRFGRSLKEGQGLAESRGGRQASQIIANLGAAALFAYFGHPLGCIAALAEAAADTASSEVGQAVGGNARLLTSWKPVPPGTDGGITWAGTCSGILSAALVVAAGSTLHLTWYQAAIAFFSAVAGFFFDSVLGATVERKGWLYNDLVNFTSTVFAAILATILS